LQLWIMLLCGLGGIVGGMWTMRHGLEQIAVGHVASKLHKLVRTPTRGLISSTLITMLMQSSGAVMMMTIALASAGTITFADTIGIILGTNIGTCVTAQIVALKLDQFALPALIAGTALFIAFRGKARYIGLALFGFGIIFFSLGLMTQSLQPLGDTAWFRTLLTKSATNPILGIVCGAVLTALIQSSTATTALTIVLAASGLVSLPGAISIVLGNNIGTCFTSILAALGAPAVGKRVALFHVALNVFGAAIFLPIILPFAAVVTRVTTDPASQVAWAHTLFNVVSSLAVWPFARPIASLMERWVPDNHSRV